MPRRLTSDAHEWMNEIPADPTLHECSSRIAQLKPIIIITMDTPNILGYRIVLL